MQRIRVRIACLALVAVIAAQAPAFGWSNGPSYGAGFGTHDWVMYKAIEIAGSRDATWVNIEIALAATDDPDMVLRDTYYHVYDVWGSPYGNSPAKVAECYAGAVASLKAGDWATASHLVGLLSHYYSDTCNPLHTDQTPEEDSMHSSYESAVDDTTTSTGSLPGWVVDDGHSHVTDVAAQTRNAAAFAHGNYSALVSGYRAGGLGGVQSITRTHLNQAANDIGDIIKSIQEDAFPFVAAPNAIYRFYNAGNGTHFYTPSAEEAEMVIARWPSVFSYEGISYFAPPAKNTQALYRFYNRRSKSHFYTASPDEANGVIARYGAVYEYEGQTFKVSLGPVAGSTPIYRFYHRGNGSHFYTASTEERDTVIARWSNIYTFEGPAFWVAQ